jgi:hypothetical protein
MVDTFGMNLSAGGSRAVARGSCHHSKTRYGCIKSPENHSKLHEFSIADFMENFGAWP